MKKSRHTKTEKRLRGGFRERDRPTLKSDTRTDDEEVEESWWSHWGVQKGTVRIWPITETRCSETAPPCITHSEATEMNWRSTVDLSFLFEEKGLLSFSSGQRLTREKKKTRLTYCCIQFLHSHPVILSWLHFRAAVHRESPHRQGREECWVCLDRGCRLEFTFSPVFPSLDLRNSFKHIQT